MFLRFYNASSLKAQIFSLVIQGIFRLGIQKRVFRSIHVSIKPEQVPNKAFSPHSENWALFTGTPGPNQKGIFILEDGKSHRFLKVALGEFSSDVIQNEAQALIHLHQKPLTSFSTPQVLLWGEEAVQMTGLQPGKREGSLTPLHQSALLELAQINNGNVPLEDIPAWKETLARLEVLSETKDDRLPKGLIRKLKTLAQQFDVNHAIKVCFSHGDFTPWNQFVYKNDLGIYDWELSESQRPVGYDAFHFVFQNGILVEHKPWTEIRTDLETQTQFLLPADSLEQYLGFYLVMNSAYFLDLYSHQENWHPQIEWLLQIWSMAVSDLLQNTSCQQGTLDSDLVENEYELSFRIQIGD